MGIREHRTEHENRIENRGYLFEPKTKSSVRITGQNVLVYVYFINEKKFIHTDQKATNLLGNIEDPFLKGGWNFWYSLIADSFVNPIKTKISEFLNPPFKADSINLTYSIKVPGGNQLRLRHEILLHPFQEAYYAINFFAFFPKIRTGKSLFFSADRQESCFEPMACNNVLISNREKEVLQLIANGYSSKEIAHQLFISDHTVISHRKNLIEKFEVKNTAHLIKKAFGYIDLS